MSSSRPGDRGYRSAVSVGQPPSLAPDLPRGPRAFRSQAGAAAGTQLASPALLVPPPQVEVNQQQGGLKEPLLFFLTLFKHSSICPDGERAESHTLALNHHSHTISADAQDDDRSHCPQLLCFAPVRRRRRQLQPRKVWAQGQVKKTCISSSLSSSRLPH